MIRYEEKNSSLEDVVVEDRLATSQGAGGAVYTVPRGAPDEMGPGGGCWDEAKPNEKLDGMTGATMGGGVRGGEDCQCWSRHPGIGRSLQRTSDVRESLCRPRPVIALRQNTARRHAIRRTGAAPSGT